MFALFPNVKRELEYRVDELVFLHERLDGGDTTPLDALRALNGPDELSESLLEEGGDPATRILFPAANDQSKQELQDLIEAGVYLVETADGEDVATNRHLSVWLADGAHDGDISRLRHVLSHAYAGTEILTGDEILIPGDPLGIAGPDGEPLPGRGISLQIVPQEDLPGVYQAESEGFTDDYLTNAGDEKEIADTPSEGRVISSVEEQRRENLPGPRYPRLTRRPDWHDLRANKRSGCSE